MSNEELVSLIQAGDRDKLVELWRQIRGMIYKQANRWAAYGSGGATAEDLVQAGFIAVLRAVSTFDQTKAKFSTHLFNYLRAEFTTATGQGAERTRRDPLQTAISLDTPLTDDDDPLTLADTIEDPEAEAALRTVEEQDRLDRLHTELEAALSSLADEEQRVIRARYYQGQTLDEIAHTEGISKNGASLREQRALRYLRHPARSKRLRAYL